MLRVAEETICKKKKKINRWISNETLKEVEKRRHLRAKGIRDTVEEAAYKQQNSESPQMMRKDKETFIQEQCQWIEGNAINNSSKELYQGIKNLTKKFHPAVDTIKNEDCIIICDRDQVQNRSRNYCSNLYKKNKDLVSTKVHFQSTTEPPLLLDEIKDAINDLKQGKSPGFDGITAEMIKNGGEKVEMFCHKLCTKIWIENKWPDEWGLSVFVPIPKSDDSLQCCNNRISLKSHSSKILLKIIAKLLAIKLNEEISEEQAGFRPGKGTRDQIINLKMVLEKNRERERGNYVFLCFIDYSKAFDTVAHDIPWNDMHRMGFPTHLILLIKALYDQQRAAVRTSYGFTEWFEIGQGVRQGCIISARHFNIYAEAIMRKALKN